MKQAKYKLQFIISVIMFGANPVFLRFIDAPSEMVAFARGIAGFIFLALSFLVLRRKVALEAIKRNALWLILAGISLGLNWIFIFQAFRITTVSIAGLCNYMSPIMVIIASPFFLKEKIGKKQLVCVFFAFLGITCVSGIFDTGLDGINLPGLALGLVGGFFLATGVLFNKKLRDIPALDSVIVQLLFCTLTTLPYVLYKNGGLVLPDDYRSGILMILFGIFNSGIAFLLYYGPMPHLPVQTIAVVGYLEPVVNVLFSVFLFREPLSIIGWLGAALIVGSTAVSELTSKAPDKSQ